MKFDGQVLSDVSARQNSKTTKATLRSDQANAAGILAHQERTAGEKDFVFSQCLLDLILYHGQYCVRLKSIAPNQHYHILIQTHYWRPQVSALQWEQSMRYRGRCSDRVADRGAEVKVARMSSCMLGGVERCRIVQSMLEASGRGCKSHAVRESLYSQ